MPKTNNDRSQSTRRIAFLGLFTACAMVLSYVELLLPPIWAAVPGVKVGLPNVIIMFLLYVFSAKDAALVSLVRVLTVTLLFGNAMMLWYSLAGAALSLAVMVLLKKTGLFSAVGVSVAGGVFHNLGQILVAMLLLQTKEIGYYMIVLAVTGTLAGVAIGLVGTLLIRQSVKLGMK